MLGIIIAAGMGRRMHEYTKHTPKCLLPMTTQGLTILDQTLNNLRAVGCTRQLIITGHARQAFAVRTWSSDVDFIHNADYKKNNILHSLMTARNFFNQPLIITYSDIWVEPNIYQHLMATEGDAVLAVDHLWQDYYKMRLDHPIEQAEKVLYTPLAKSEFDHADVIALGKVLPIDSVPICPSDLGEFLGLMKFSTQGAKQFREDFLALDNEMDLSTPFKQAATWQQAYLTDLIQYQINHGGQYTAALVAKGWAEFDTLEDYLRLEKIMQQQKLNTLMDPAPKI